MVLMGSHIPDLHHIGPESHSSHSTLISVVCPLKISLSPVKYCLGLVTQTKPIRTPDWMNWLIYFSILLIIPFTFFYFSLLCSLIHFLSSLLVLFSKRKRSETSKCINILFFSQRYLFFFYTNCVVSSGVSWGCFTQQSAGQFPLSVMQ